MESYKENYKEKKGLPLGVKRKSEGWDWVFPKYRLIFFKVGIGKMHGVHESVL